MWGSKVGAVWTSQKAPLHSGAQMVLWHSRVSVSRRRRTQKRKDERAYTSCVGISIPREMLFIASHFPGISQADKSFLSPALSPCLVVGTRKLCPELAVGRQCSALGSQQASGPAPAALGSEEQQGLLSGCSTDSLNTCRKCCLPNSYPKGHVNHTVTWLLRLDDIFRWVSECSPRQWLS